MSDTPESGQPAPAAGAPAEPGTEAQASAAQDRPDAQAASGEPAAQPTAAQPTAGAHPASEEPTAAQPVTAQQPTAAPPADSRPAPEYGEYAPEGWEWKPPVEEERPAAQSGVAHAGQAAGGSAPVSGTVPGVPHNLGAGSARPSKQSGTPYQAPPAAQQQGTQRQPQAQQQTQQQPGFQPQPGQPGAQRRPNPVDRVFTVLLLALGAYGAVQSAFAMMGMGTMFEIMGEAPGIDGVTVPAWLDITGKVFGIAILAFYGLVLVYSIRRIRAGKIAFWAPLTAGVIVTVLMVAVITIGIALTPELMSAMADPERSSELLKYLQEFQQR